MRISKEPFGCEVAVANLKHGACLFFRQRFHSNHRDDDYFIKVKVAPCYTSPDVKATKVCVVNLRTGISSFIDECKTCIPVDAEVCIL